MARVILHDLPEHVKGFVCEGEDGEPVIVVNSKLDYYQQRDAYDHELSHIRHDDLHNMHGILEVESA